MVAARRHHQGGVAEMIDGAILAATASTKEEGLEGMDPSYIPSVCEPHLVFTNILSRIGAISPVGMHGEWPTATGCGLSSGWEVFESMGRRS
jgi:hypothetical protein